MKSYSAWVDETEMLKEGKVSAAVVKDFLYLFFTLSLDVVALIRHCFFFWSSYQTKNRVGCFFPQWLHSFELCSFAFDLLMSLHSLARADLRIKESQHNRRKRSSWLFNNKASCVKQQQRSMFAFTPGRALEPTRRVVKYDVFVVDCGDDSFGCWWAVKRLRVVTFLRWDYVEEKKEDCNCPHDNWRYFKEKNGDGSLILSQINFFAHGSKIENISEKLFIMVVSFYPIEKSLTCSWW